jgi:hypothetical protein
MKSLTSIKEQLAAPKITMWITMWLAANPDTTRARLAKCFDSQNGVGNFSRAKVGQFRQAVKRCPEGISSSPNL